MRPWMQLFHRPVTFKPEYALRSCVAEQCVRVCVPIWLDGGERRTRPRGQLKHQRLFSPVDGTERLALQNILLILIMLFPLNMSNFQILQSAFLINGKTNIFQYHLFQKAFSADK